MTEVVSNLKPDPEPCVCGCGKVGQPNKRNGHVRLCDASKCASCRGRRANAKGNKAGTKVRKHLGLPGVNSRHEEVWGGHVRTESKEGGMARPVITAHLNVTAQSEAARPMGDSRPFLGSFTYKNCTVFTIGEDQLEAVVAALAEQWGMTG